MLCAMVVVCGLVVDGQHFSGSLLGVSAKATLCGDRRTALITLSGLPIGGEVSGEARLESDGAVKVEEPLRGVLSRRLVRIDAVEVVESGLAIAVHLALPFGIGRKHIKLTKEEQM